jgi:CelD/BcsL family acetyltransferase involved in cellulose biosynthesis/glycosyltransferase involved in cell wall biosynthesis
VKGQQELLCTSKTAPTQQLSGQGQRGAVIVPAYNEAAVIKRTLAPLSGAAVDGFIELIVVCNGCTDDTAEVARSVPGVRVVELEQGSKPAALNAGDEAATLWPRLYLDADIQISAAAVLAVLDRLAQGDVLAARPACRYDSDGASALVRSFYRARRRIPQHKLAMWGAGAYGLSAKGHQRIGAFPMVTGDDLYVDTQFDAAEKVVVATEPSVVRTPSDVKSLLAILRRGHRGNAELSARGEESEGRKRNRSLETAVAVVRTIRGPQSAVDAAVYLGIASAKRRSFRKVQVWERDETSRSSGGPKVPAHTASRLRIDHVHSLEDLDRVRDEWDSFVEQSGSDIYFMVDWLQAWWTHYGQGRTFHGLIMWDGARMVGALPFCVQRVWAGPVSVRLAKFVGADSTIPVFTPAIAEGFEEPVVHAALELLFDDAGCDAVSLSPLSGLSPVAVAAERAAAGDAFRLVHSDSPGPHTVFKLPGSFEEYLQSLSKAQRKTHRRYLRTLNSCHEISFRTVSGDEAIGCFDRFVELHAAQWRPRGKLGHFGDWPASADFNRDLISRMAATGRVRFYELAGDGRVLALEYCFVLGERCYFRLRARDPDPELEKLRIGRLSHTEMFRLLIEAGQRVVETGPGHYDYKLRLGAEEHQLRRIVISRRSGPPRWRTAVLVRWADLLQLAYYRGWFLKVRPRLGLSPRPLRQPWIVTRI